MITYSMLSLLFLSPVLESATFLLLPPALPDAALELLGVDDGGSFFPLLNSTCGPSSTNPPPEGEPIFLPLLSLSASFCCFFGMRNFFFSWAEGGGEGELLEEREGERRFLLEVEESTLRCLLPLFLSPLLLLFLLAAEGLELEEEEDFLPLS